MDAALAIGFIALIVAYLMFGHQCLNWLAEQRERMDKESGE